MTKKLIFALVVACGAGVAACDSSPTDGGRPQYDVTGKRTTTTTAAKPPGDTLTATMSGGNIGDPCDPETYTGPYRCILNPNGDGGYIVAY